MEESDEYVIEFGVIVQIVGGRHKGKFGYYDDDNERGRAMIYMGFPTITDDYVEVDKRFLAEPTSEQRATYEEIYLEACRVMMREDKERKRQQVAHVNRHAIMTHI